MNTRSYFNKINLPLAFFAFFKSRFVGLNNLDKFFSIPTISILPISTLSSILFLDVLLISSLSIAKYSKKDLQCIYKIMLDIKTFISKKPYKYFLKVKFLDIYYKKFYIDCYQFY